MQRERIFREHAPNVSDFIPLLRQIQK